MSFWLIMKTADGGRRPFELSKERTIIGREVQSDVRIPIPSVEPRHCEIHFAEDELRLKDLGSQKGVLHNGLRVHEAILADADELTIGPVTFELRFGDGDPEETPERKASGELESKPLV